MQQLSERLEARAMRQNLEVAEMALVSAVSSTPGEPRTFQEAMRDRNKSKWKEAIMKESHDIRNKGVRRKVKKSSKECIKTAGNQMGVQDQK